MNLYYYENMNINKVTDDGVREFCLCERVNEEYMRLLVKRALAVEGIMKMGRKRNKPITFGDSN